MNEYVKGILFVVLVGMTPIVLLMSAKLVAFGWYRGKHLFEESLKGKTDGEEKKETP